MIRLAVLRASIALWKRVISISDLLKPSTWKMIAVIQGVLAVAMFSLYLVPETNEQDVPPVHVTDIRPPLPLRVVAPQVSIINLEPLTAHNRPFNLSINGANFNREAVSAIVFRAASSRLVQARWDAAGSNSVLFFAGHSWNSSIKTASLSSVSSHWFMNTSNSAGTPTVVIQMPPPAQMSLVQTAQAVVLLVQGVFLTIGSIFASVFAWVGYRRGKADLLLKQLQVRELQLKVEKMERDRARELQAAANSGIILCN